MESRILLVGNDDKLQETRALILNQRWSTFLARPNDAMRSLEAEQPDLVILCHTLCRDEAQALVRACRDKFHEARILALEARIGSARELKADAVVETMLGPQPMLSAIEVLLGDRALSVKLRTHEQGPPWQDSGKSMLF
jgi:DNA-binding response OmpR family regulator